jgi:hypothetical protein
MDSIEYDAEKLIPLIRAVEDLFASAQISNLDALRVHLVMIEFLAIKDSPGSLNTVLDCINKLVDNLRGS